MKKKRKKIKTRANQANQPPSGQEYDSWNGNGAAGNASNPGHQELNSTQARKGEGDKGRGKGKGGGGKGKEDKGKGNGKADSGPPRDGCFICEGPHWASECPHNPLKQGQQGREGG